MTSELALYAMIDVGFEITYICLEARIFLDGNLHWLSIDSAIRFSTFNKHMADGIPEIGAQLLLFKHNLDIEM